MSKIDRRRLYLKVYKEDGYSPIQGYRHKTKKPGTITAKRVPEPCVSGWHFIRPDHLKDWWQACRVFVIIPHGKIVRHTEGEDNYREKFVAEQIEFVGEIKYSRPKYETMHIMDKYEEEITKLGYKLLREYKEKKQRGLI